MERKTAAEPKTPPMEDETDLTERTIGLSDSQEATSFLDMEQIFENMKKQNLDSNAGAEVLTLLPKLRLHPAYVLQQPEHCFAKQDAECDPREVIGKQHSRAHDPRQRSLLSESESFDADEDGEGCEHLPGVLSPGVNYNPKRVVVEGWLYKKGTGMDYFGSRGWKARWTKLVWAQVEGREVDLPLLLVYWYEMSETPSTVIALDSTVVLPVDLDDRTRWSCHRFEVRHATSQENSTLPVTRLFSAPREDRDTWVYAISEALLEYEKHKAKQRNFARQIAEPTFDEVWKGDRFLSVEMRRPTSPLSSPPPATYQLPRLSGAPPLPQSESSSKCPLPRPSKNNLVGESFA